MTAPRIRPFLEAALPLLRQGACPDAELLARFLADRDEAAFEVLVRRHAPAVRAACRGWLRSPADIDDAAQATFLVLVRRAGSIRDRAAVGRWLYRVADNVARRLRQQRPHAALPADVPGREPAGDAELRDLLAEEVARLPEKYRLPVQLCYWAGLTTAEAAARLGWPRGTVLTRLAGARDRLRRRLTRLGLAPAAAGAVAVPAGAVSGGWARATARAAKVMLAGGGPADAGVSQRTVSLAVAGDLTTLDRCGKWMKFPAEKWGAGVFAPTPLDSLSHLETAAGTARGTAKVATTSARSRSSVLA